MKNIHKIYTFNFFWIFVVILPVLYPYYATLGINMHEFFQLQAVFGLTVAFFEIPTGYFSDHFGRKLSLCIGGLISASSYLILYFATGYWGLLFHEFLLGLALSFISGTDIALLFDSLPQNAKRDDSSAVLGINQLATTAGESISALFCSALLFLSYKHLILAQVIIAWMPFIISLFIQEAPRHQKITPQFSNIKTVWNSLLKNNRFVVYLSCNFITWVLATFIIVWVIQKYWQENHIPLQWFGVLWALCNISIGLAGLIARRLEKQHGLKHLLLIVGVGCTCAYIGMSLTSGWVGICFGLLAYLARGINNVVSRDILNQNIPAHLRATANSILNFLFRIIFVFIGPAIGFSIDSYGAQPTLFVIGLAFLLLFIFITLPLIKMIKTDSII